MTDTKQPALSLADELERDAVNDIEHSDVAMSSYEHEIRKMSAALKTNAVNALRSQHARIAELEEEVHKLQLLTQGNGSEAYDIACEEMECWQQKRAAAGKDEGTTHSLVDGMAWLYEHIEELEAQLAAGADSAPCWPQLYQAWRHVGADAAGLDWREFVKVARQDPYAGTPGAGGVTGLPDAQPFRSITWPKGREAGRMGDMTPLGESHLRVGFDADNDVYVSVFNQAHGAGDIEFCTHGQGGGKSPRTREALIALMVAMEEDSKETPSFAFPPGAAIAQEGGK